MPKEENTLSMETVLAGQHKGIEKNLQTRMIAVKIFDAVFASYLLYPTIFHLKW